MTASNHREAQQHTLPPRLQGNLSRNLTALRQARPAVFDAITTADFSHSDRYTIRMEGVNSDQPMLYRRDDSEQWSCISLDSPGTNPIAPYREALTARGAKTLCGIGDGCILHWLANHPPQTNTTGDALVYLLEPDLELIVYCMMLRDMSSGTGPIRDSRFHWFVGPDWQRQAEQTMRSDMMLVDSGCVVGQGAESQRIKAFWTQLRAQRAESFERDCKTAQDHADALTAHVLADVLSESPSRPPRVLLMTSLHTTVLQHSTRDAQHAFDQLGWETNLLIEPTAHHVMGEQAVMRTIASFKPDLLFCIDHLRRELPRIPAQIPHLCWVQDDLPNLTTSDAGRSVRLRDFVMGAWIGGYVRNYAYPKRQCIEMRRLTQSPSHTAPPPQRDTGVDLLYVSNHSDPPRQRLARIVAEAEAAGRVEAPTRPLLQIAGEAMIASYEGDTALRSREAVTEFLLQTAPDAAACDATTLDGMTRSLMDLNNTLYRQQALRWVAKMAQQRGLTLALYGNGWQNHPAFSAYACGTIVYGEQLQQLTRNSTINLQLEPFSPTHHQRLLDGLAAGGFFLSRLLQPHGPALQDWLQFVQSLDDDIQSMQQAQNRLDAGARDRMNTLADALVAADPSLAGTDLIVHARSDDAVVGQRLLRTAPYPPHYRDIAFYDEAELVHKLDRYLRDHDARQAIVKQQQRFVEAGFTYVSGLKAVQQAIASAIADEQAATAAGDVVYA